MNPNDNLVQPYNGVALAGADSAPQQLNAAETANRVMLSGNNPSTTGYLLISIVNEGGTPPTIAQMRAGMWDYRVPPGASWYDTALNVNAFGCWQSQTEVETTVYTRERSRSVG